MEWTDSTEMKIEAGDILHNPFNDPPDVPVLADSDGNLYLGDFDTPFDDRYQFHRFWIIKGRMQTQDNTEKKGSFAPCSTCTHWQDMGLRGYCRELGMMTNSYSSCVFFKPKEVKKDE